MNFVLRVFEGEVLIGIVGSLERQGIFDWLSDSLLSENLSFMENILCLAPELSFRCDNMDF
jgi:hypothetical protein